MRHLKAALLTALLTTPAAAQEIFPDPGRPIILVNNFSAGGQISLALRDFEPFFAEEFGTGIQVEQIEGAAGLIGYNTVFARPADGYTILTYSTNFGPHTFTSLAQTPPPWTFEDWEPLGIYADNISLGFMVRADSPIQTFPDMVRAAKADPGGLTVGTIGPGRIEDVQIEELKQVFGIDVNNVYYDSGSTLFTDLLTGDLDVIMSAAIPYVDNSDVRIITMLAKGMPDSFPYRDLKTMADWQDELGYDADDLTTLSRSQVYGLLVKAGLPDAAFDRLVAGLKAVAENPEWQAQVADYRDTVYYPPEEAKAIMTTLRDGILEIMANKQE
jgi:tripartite-type tricarboxylate transporter receptor subunit TctC